MWSDVPGIRQLNGMTDARTDLSVSSPNPGVRPAGADLLPRSGRPGHIAWRRMGEVGECRSTEGGCAASGVGVGRDRCLRSPSP
jgi:hypothetical protein